MREIEARSLGPESHHAEGMATDPVQVPDGRQLRQGCATDLTRGTRPCGYGRAAPMKVDAYQSVFFGSFCTSSPVRGASMM